MVGSSTKILENGINTVENVFHIFHKNRQWNIAKPIAGNTNISPIFSSDNSLSVTKKAKELLSNHAHYNGNA